MKTLLQHLENESLLLMYMAGELPLSDRTELEAMLARDGGLRAQLAELRAAESSCFAGLAQLDVAEPLGSVEPSVRRVQRAIQQWQIDLLARPAQQARARRRIPVLAWSAGSAVAAVLVFCTWWGFRADTGPHSTLVPPADTGQVADAPSDGDSLGDQSPSSFSPDNSSSNLNSGQMVSVDSATQLSELENVVNDDLPSANIGE
jgi:hypothetical protein